MFAAVCSPAAAQGPELFSRNGKGWGQAVADNLTVSGRSPNSTLNSGSPGQEVAVSGAGLRGAAHAQVYVAGQPAKSRLVRNGGVDEIVFRVPESSSEGCAVPVDVRSAGPLPTNVVSIAIRRGAGECRDAEFIPFSHWSGSRNGLVLLTRKASEKSAVPVDEMSAWFVKLGAMDVPFPPPGACTSRSSDDRKGEGAAPTLLDLLADQVSASLLDAGPFVTVDDGKTLRRLRPAFLRGFYGVELAGPRVTANPLRMTDLHVAGEGGADVGPIHFRLHPSEPLDLITPVTEVDRARGLTVDWRAAGDSVVVIALSVGDSLHQTHGVCFCVAPPGSNRFTIAPEWLARFPAISPGSNGAEAIFTIATWPRQPTKFSAAGLDHGLAASSFVRSHTIAFR